MSKNLLIVESPTKAKTITRFLPSNFIVKASYGHIRDLPEKNFGIEIENNFLPNYIILPKKKRIAQELKKLSKNSKEIYFGTDEDREGEAIAWHISKILELKEDEIKRITFHEITKEAILDALKNPRNLNLNLVNSQQARRILDRIVGYLLSPFLWKKIAKRLSAGRVQSAALRMIVEKEEEIEKFKPKEYWSIKADFIVENKQIKNASLYKINNQKLDKFEIKSKQEAENLINEIKKCKFKIFKISEKLTKKYPYPPFTTSQLQQEANKKLGFTSKYTMQIAQELYEGIELGKFGRKGLITYHRTDSLNLSFKFINYARKFIKENLGIEYLPEKPKLYKTKSKLAQEAHEAIRPTDIFLVPEKIKHYLSNDQFKLYSLIYKRALASQCKECEILQKEVIIKGENSKNFYFKTLGSQIIFDGFTKVYEINIIENLIPQISENKEAILEKLYKNQHFTKPPARFTDASLVKELETKGIGRPSTYATIIDILIRRNYVKRIQKKLVPTNLGKLVSNVLKSHFYQIVDYDFTAKMENELDEIARGEKKWIEVIKEFYYPFKKNLDEKYKSVNKNELIIPSINKKCPKCGANLVIRFGKFGEFLACSNFPKCNYTENIIKKIGVKCPNCGKDLIEKQTKNGKIFYGCINYPKCKYATWRITKKQ